MATCHEINDAILSISLFVVPSSLKTKRSEVGFKLTDLHDDDQKKINSILEQICDSYNDAAAPRQRKLKRDDFVDFLRQPNDDITVESRRIMDIKPAFKRTQFASEIAVIASSKVFDEFWIRLEFTTQTTMKIGRVQDDD